LTNIAQAATLTARLRLGNATCLLGNATCLLGNATWLLGPVPRFGKQVPPEST
tara:strand:+ start:499 stop:657 length:159 start_codon:yes stop_codon:yes gene_type:complete